MKTYNLTRNNELVCVGLTRAQANMIAVHFNHPHDHFKIYEIGTNAFHVFNYETKQFDL